MVDNISLVLSQLVAGEIKHILRDTTGEGALELAPGFLQTSHHVSLSPLLIFLCILVL